MMAKMAKMTMKMMTTKRKSRRMSAKTATTTIHDVFVVVLMLLETKNTTTIHLVSEKNRSWYRRVRRVVWRGMALLVWR
jgi:hypothetical protein